MAENDTIYRQAAIEELQEHRKLFCDNTPETFSGLPYSDKCRVDELDMAIATLINLPSAQPEIVRCEDCRNRGDDDCPMRFIEWVEYDDDGYIEYDDIIHDYTKDDGFCDRAERRTDGHEREN